jgi:hypothetical protein
MIEARWLFDLPRCHRIVITAGIVLARRVHRWLGVAQLGIQGPIAYAGAARRLPLAMGAWISRGLGRSFEPPDLKFRDWGSRRACMQEGTARGAERLNGVAVSAFFSGTLASAIRDNHTHDGCPRPALRIGDVSRPTPGRGEPRV